MRARRGPSRRATVLAALALGVAGLVVGGASWATATTRDGLDAVVVVDVAGGAVAPGVTAGAVVVVAAALALTLAGRWAAPVVGALVAGGGLLQLGSGLAVLRSSEGLERAARRAALEQVGVDALTAAPHTGVWPWLAVVVGLLTVVLGGLAVVAGRRWTADRRHTAPSGGADDGAPEPGGPGGPGAPGGPRGPGGPGGPGGPARASEPSDHDDDPAVWDRLSSGDDPT